MEGSGARRFVESDSDVIVFLKRYASDEGVCQRPLLVLPHQFLSRLPTPVPEDTRAMKPLDLERRKGWLELARYLNDARMLSRQDKDRAILYLVDAAAGSSSSCCPKEALPWHATAHQQNLVLLQNLRQDSTFLKLFPVARFRATIKR